MNASTAHKELRVLSGTHAGASVDLTAGSHSLGASPQFDISIADWRFAALNLRVEQDATVVAQWSGSSPHALRFDDWAPVDFAGVILCLGPTGKDWPERSQLMQALRSVEAAIAPPVAARAVRTLDRRLVAWGGTSLVALVAAGWIATASSEPHEARVPTLRAAGADLQQALDRATKDRLQVSEASGALVVDGVVDDARQAQLAMRAIDGVPHSIKVVRRFSVASEIAETIRTSVGLPGAHIDYRGNGVFSFAATTSDVAATQSELNRVASDLAPTVRRIDAVLEEPPMPHPPLPAVLSALTTEDGIDVMETRDGVKHLVVSSPSQSSTPSSPAL
jgi:type III secretion protein D